MPAFVVMVKFVMFSFNCATSSSIAPIIPSLAFALLIYAGLYGIQNNLTPPPASDINLFKADEETLSQFKKLPASLDEAITVMKESTFIRKHLPEQIIELYSRKLI